MTSKERKQAALMTYNRTTKGFGPISREMLEVVKRDPINNMAELSECQKASRAMTIVFADFVRDEMSMERHAMEELKISKMFLPVNKQSNKLYVHFADQSSVNKLYKYAKNIDTNRPKYLIATITF